ncbi:MAG: hypothetical protein A2Z27_02620 [candidate division Zixibacteria bacterium RBG_16_50_21]|nr:MAG: hypothetical protein A2Z27_02620 [candidate division Zixibacteria bacterium RBG_16_50_21]
MHMKRIVALVAVVAGMLFGLAWGQDDSAQVTLRISSTPPGVTVNMDGPFQLTTTTPTEISQPLTGRYHVKAEKFGYESWETYVTLTPNQPASLKINLSPKTRVKAALRSVLIPGWGQFYSDRKGWGYFFAVGTATLAAGFILADLHYSNQYDQYVDVRNEFDRAATIEEKTNLKQNLDDEQREAYDAENLRNAALGIAAGFWAFNVVDNIFFFPSAESGVFERLSSNYDVRTGQVKLTYTQSIDF